MVLGQFEDHLNELEYMPILFHNIVNVFAGFQMFSDLVCTGAFLLMNYWARCLH